MQTFGREEQIDVLKLLIRQDWKHALANGRLLDWLSAQVERRKQSSPSSERDEDLDAFDALQCLVQQKFNRHMEDIDRNDAILKEMERERVHGKT